MFQAVTLAFVLSAFYVALLQVALALAGVRRPSASRAFVMVAWGAAAILALAWALRMAGALG